MPPPGDEASTFARLGAEVAAMAARGDVEGARILNDAIGRLLVVRTDPGGADVVNLDERRKPKGTAKR